MTSTWTPPRTWPPGEIVTAALLNTHLRDQLEWLKGRPYGTEQDFDGTVYSAASSSFMDTGISSGSVTTTGGRVLVICWGCIAASTTSGNPVSVTLYEDGVNKGDATYGMARMNSYTSAVDTILPFCLMYITPTAPTAAAHEWKLYAKDNGVNGFTFRTAYIAAFEIGV